MRRLILGRASGGLDASEAPFGGPLETFHQAIGRGDVDEVLECLHPEVEIRPAVNALDAPRQYLGRDGARELFEAFNDDWQSMIVEIKETVHAPENRLLAVEHWQTGGRYGIELDAEITDLYVFRDGLIIRVDGFRDKAEALEAAGLRE